MFRPAGPPGKAGTNGSVTVAISSTTPDKNGEYYKNGEFARWEIGIITRFANEYGCGVEFLNSCFSGILAAVANPDFRECGCRTAPLPVGKPDRGYF